ncbi:hypothetical protein [Halomicrococcus sp. NG-SE-24]
MNFGIGLGLGALLADGHEFCVLLGLPDRLEELSAYLRCFCHEIR